MSNDIVCPNCARDDELSGQPHGGLIRITCARCDLVWDRDPSPMCAACGKGGLRPVAQAVWEKARGTQLSTVALRTIYLCPECDADVLRRHLDSGSPVPPDENPVANTR
jgi:hypothetical protein